MFIFTEAEAWGTYWPLIFRPNELDRDRIAGLSAAEIATVVQHIKLVNEDTIKLKNRGHMYSSGALMVNPLNNRVVITASQALDYLVERHGASVLQHPLYTPTMLCVEGVAAIIRGEISDGGTSANADAYPLLCDDPYLCTGLHLYLAMEPDLMSAMSLVHSRIGRVFFRDSDPDQGALLTCVQLHSLPALNHHFRVYKVR
jgi:hypothetical protein